MRYFVGLDLGQAADYTAIAVLEKQIPTEEVEAPVRVATGVVGMVKARKALPYVLACGHLERVPLGTSYPDIVAKVAAMLTSPRLLGQTVLAVDATGVGRAVTDLLRRARLKPVPLTITPGATVSSDGDGWKVPKRDLVAAVQVLLQTKRLRFAAGLASVAALVDELLRFKVKIDPVTAHDSYGAWREGEHDDLVLALACGAWYAERWKPPPFRSPSTYQIEPW